jgi:hypothetical protein
MQRRWQDRLTPTSTLLVSRAWVLDEVARLDGLDAAQRERLVDELTSYEPLRRDGLRNSFIVWLGLIGGSWLARLVGLPAWSGFVAALIVFVCIARVLAVGALRWRLQRLLQELRTGR